MSCLDLSGSISMRKRGMKARIDVLKEEIACAHKTMAKMLTEAESYLDQLDGDPAMLRPRFLAYMSHLDDYIYSLADFNMGLSNLDKNPCVLQSQDIGSPSDVPNKDTTPPPAKYVAGGMKSSACLFDMLSEPISTKATCMPFTAGHQQGRAIKKNNDCLLDFSSTSSVDSGRKVPAPIPEQIEENQAFFAALEPALKNLAIALESDAVKPPPVAEEAAPPSYTETLEVTPPTEETVVSVPVVVSAVVQSSLKPVVMAGKNLSNVDESPAKGYCLPQQVTLELDRCYDALIIHVDNPSSFFVVVECMQEMKDLYREMELYYTKHFLSVKNGVGELVAACIDSCWHRCLIYNLKSLDAIEVYLVDLGCEEEVSYRNIQPLIPQFCQKPPFARTCHLAGVEPGPGDWSEEAVQIVKGAYGELVKIVVEENTSESLGVSVILPNDEMLSSVLVDKGHAYTNMTSETRSGLVPPAAEDESEEIMDFDVGPEHEDILEAVQGYSNRDEKDICKHYKGPPDTTCFKGLHCKKRHEVIRADGFTLDRLEVCAGTINEMTFPGPGTNIKVYVVFIASCKSFFSYLYTDTTKDLPPHNRALEELVKEMNTLQAHTSLLPLKLMPAKGEVVIARYPLDGKFYRARVVEEDRNNYRVRYLDFGSLMWLEEKDLRQMSRRFLSVPFQAVACSLAGVTVQDPDAAVSCNEVLTKLLLAKTFDAFVVSTSHDSLELTLFDGFGFSIADMLITEHHKVFRKTIVGKPKSLKSGNIIPG